MAKRLSLEEVIGLGKKVEFWKKHGNGSDTAYSGTIGDVCVTVSKDIMSMSVMASYNRGRLDYNDVPLHVAMRDVLDNNLGGFYLNEICRENLGDVKYTEIFRVILNFYNTVEKKYTMQPKEKPLQTIEEKFAYARSLLKK